MKYIILPIFRLVFLLYVLCFLTPLALFLDLFVICAVFLWGFSIKEVKQNLKHIVSEVNDFDHTKLYLPFIHKNYNGEDIWVFFSKYTIEYKSSFFAVWNIQPIIIKS